MATTSLEIGYLPEDINVTAHDITLESLPHLSEAIESIKECKGVRDGWIYAPSEETNMIDAVNPRVEPYTSRVFGLPKTHRLTHHQSESPEHLNFLIWCISFFKGIRLTSTEAGFLDATPMKTGTLTDFILVERTIADSFVSRALGNAISVSEIFWKKHSCDSKTTKRIEGAINALFLSQYPRSLEFERFTYLYMALDSCWALTESLIKIKSQNHAQRIDCMCNIFRIPTPDWANPTKKNGKASEISIVRNNSIHEALFCGEPLGFSIYENPSEQGENTNILMEMRALVCRLLVAIITGPASTNDYFSLPINSRFPPVLEFPAQAGD